MDSAAERIADYFSRDAATWRPRYIHLPATRPVFVAFRFAQPAPDYAPLLLDSLHRATTPTRTEAAHEHAMPISSPPAGRQPDATVTFTAEERDGSTGVAYELSFRHSYESFPGWFALTV
jgi:hypothetical protein